MMAQTWDSFFVFSLMVGRFGISVCEVAIHALYALHTELEATNVYQLTAEFDSLLTNDVRCTSLNFQRNVMNTQCAMAVPGGLKILFGLAENGTTCVVAAQEAGVQCNMDFREMTEFNWYLQIKLGERFYTPNITPIDYSNTLIPIKNGQTELNVLLKGCNDGHILLAPDDTELANGYEFVIGGWNNKQSVIRQSAQGTALAQSPKPLPILDCDRYKPFVVGWTAGRVRLSAGFVGAESVLVEYNDPNPKTVQYVRLAAGFGSPGSWIVF